MPGDYVLATAHRAGNVDDPDRLAALVELLCGVGQPVLLALHPRTVARLQPFGLRARLDECGAVQVCEPLGYFETAALMCNAARGADRFRRPAEGGLSGRRAVRDDAAEHGVDRDRADGLEHARRSRSDAARAALATPAPTARPPLYGDGHAGERVVDSLRLLQP